MATQLARVHAATVSIALLLMICLAVTASPVDQKPSKDLADASLEELMNVEVTSVSKKEERLSHAAAAIYVITQEDIRRSVATTIPELLRMVPGLDVAQINTNSWAISARGFNDKFANKLLVLIDGRSVYSELFSGTFWDVQGMVLEDIERIEVIRGPGATMWGANAVNGVINIITKRAKDTQGALASAGAGSSQRGFGEFRYGGKLGSSAYYRAYATAFDRAPLPDAKGVPAENDWSGIHGGFRLDWNASAHDLLTVEGDSYRTGLDRSMNTVTLTPPFLGDFQGRVEARGGSLLTKWQHILSGGSEVDLQISYEHSFRQELYAAPELNVLDVDFEHRLALSDRNSLLWGIGYRFTNLELHSGFEQPLPFQRLRNDSLFQAFVQEEFQLVPEWLTFTFGSKFEHNPFTGFEVQPSVRLTLTPASRQTLWAAVSRAVRTPSVIDVGINADISAFAGPMGLPALVTTQGNQNFRSEDLLAYEFGYRVEPSKNVSLDLATFYDVYNNLRSTELATPYFVSAAPAHLVIPSQFTNGMRARTYGAELALNAKLSNWWRVSASYTWLKMVPSADAASTAPGTVTSLAHGNPQHQFQIRSYLDLPWRLQLDTTVYAVSSLTALNIRSYVQSDARLGWRATQNLELSVGGENLLNGSHVEFFVPGELDERPLTIGRSVYGKITWRF